MNVQESLYKQVTVRIWGSPNQQHFRLVKYYHFARPILFVWATGESGFRSGEPLKNGMMGGHIWTFFCWKSRESQSFFHPWNQAQNFVNFSRIEHQLSCFTLFWPTGFSWNCWGFMSMQQEGSCRLCHLVASVFFHFRWFLKRLGRCVDDLIYHSTKSLLWYRWTMYRLLTKKQL